MTEWPFFKTMPNNLLQRSYCQILYFLNYILIQDEHSNIGIQDYYLTYLVGIYFLLVSPFYEK